MKRKIKKTLFLFFSSILLSISVGIMQGDQAVFTSSSADYVIVGAGTAGCILARLLTDADNSVIVLEAGNNRTNEDFFKYSKYADQTGISFVLDPPYFEVGLSTPQASLDGRSVPWALPKIFGGASQLTIEYYARGTNTFFSQWQAIAGDEWSPKKIIDTFVSLEHYRGMTTDPSARGYAGNLSIRQAPTEQNSITQKLNRAIMAATGIATIIDYNDPNSFFGTSNTVQYAQQGADGTLRESSATGFLGIDVMSPDGFGLNGRQLQVIFDARALRTLWERNRAAGVEYFKDGQHERAFARKGVIVCAGLRSSAFLMHSGVGPASLLKSLQIPVQYDNPNVGQNLIDQPVFFPLFTKNPDDQLPSDPNVSLLQTSFLGAPGSSSNQREVILAGIDFEEDLIALFVQFPNIKSRGKITISSKDPLVAPVIDFGYLTHPDDIQLMKSIIKNYIKNIAEQLALIDPAYQLISPDPSILNDDVQIEDYIKDNLLSPFSITGHCKMAPLDQGGVVDSYGRVYGVRNLYVADVSIVPIPHDGVTSALGFLIGARMAQFLNGF